MRADLLRLDHPQSNISVGLPIDVLWYPRDCLRVGHAAAHRRGRSLLHDAAPGWGGGLRRVFAELPDPDWLE